MMFREPLEVILGFWVRIGSIRGHCCHFSESYRAVQTKSAPYINIASTILAMSTFLVPRNCKKELALLNKGTWEQDRTFLPFYEKSVWHLDETTSNYITLSDRWGGSSPRSQRAAPHMPTRKYTNLKLASMNHEWIAATPMNIRTSPGHDPRIKQSCV